MKARISPVPTLQNHCKRENSVLNLHEGDLLLLRDKDAPRNSWPLGLVDRVLLSSGDLVHKVEVRVVRQDGLKTLARPVTDLVLLVPKSEG